MKYSNLGKHVLVSSILKNSVRRPSRLGLPIGLMRQSMKQLCRVFPMPRDMQIKRMRIAGCTTEWIQPKKLTSSQVILHIHGGAFFLGGLDTHRAFVAKLAQQQGCCAIQVDYPLAPEHPFPAASEALYAVYTELLQQGISADQLVLSGDSCGGNLAVGLCLRLKELKQPMPAALLLQSPWLDLTLSSPSLRYNRKQDALLSIQTLQAGIAHYVGNRIRHDNPQLSPILDNLSELPPVLLQVGSGEILLDDAQRFQQQAKAAGVDVSLKIYPGMWHNFQMFYSWFAEAQTAMLDLKQFVQQHSKSV